jgi:hypothetical protein
VFEVAARFAICPMKLRSPVAITTPFPDPSLLSVPKNARFLVSRGLSLVHSTLLKSNSVSPVNEELSTFMAWESMTLISAGIFFPSSTLITSPTTNKEAFIFFSYPSLITIVSGGIKSLNPVINA